LTLRRETTPKTTRYVRRDVVEAEIAQ